MGDAGRKGKSAESPWPKYDAALAKEEEIEIPVQVNGKLRGVVTVPVDASEDHIKSSARALEKVIPHVAGKQIVKMIVVPGKLVNIVVR